MRPKFCALSAFGLAALAFGQASGPANRATTGQQTLQGVLLDANCPNLMSSNRGPMDRTSNSAGSASSDINRGRPGDSRISAGGGTTSGDARARTEAAATATGPGTTGAYTGTGAAPDTRGTPPEMRRTTQVDRRDMPMPRSTSATASGPGTSGAYSGNGIAGSGAPRGTEMPRGTKPDMTSGPAGNNNMPRTTASAAIANSATSAVGTSDVQGRSRTTEMAHGESFSACMAKPTTTAFALHANGRMVLLDDASNQMVRDRMSSGAFASNTRNEGGTPSSWNTVTVTGSYNAEKFTVSSLQAGDKK